MSMVITELLNFEYVIRNKFEKKDFITDHTIFQNHGHKWKIYRYIDVSGAEESSGREGEGRFPQKNTISG